MLAPLTSCCGNGGRALLKGCGGTEDYVRVVTFRDVHWVAAAQKITLQRQSVTRPRPVRPKLNHAAALEPTVTKPNGAVVDFFFSFSFFVHLMH